MTPEIELAIGGIRPIEIQLGAGESADDAIAVRAELEIELDFYRRARSGTDEANRIAVAANRRNAVQRPRDRFQNRRLAGAVGADDAGETTLEADLGPHMLAEIRELEVVQLHAFASSTVGPATRSASRR